MPQKTPVVYHDSTFDTVMTGLGVVFLAIISPILIPLWLIGKLAHKIEDMK